jgi:hypothetical protein
MTRPPQPRSPRDTLDDVDRQEDAVHEVTDPLDPLREEPTDIQRDDDRVHTDPMGSRELPTGPQQERTAPWMQATPWVSPDRPEEKPTDHTLLAVVVFVLVLLACIGVFVFKETHKGLG